MILKQICDYFKPFKIKPVLIPSSLKIPFLSFTEEEIIKLDTFKESEYGIVRDYRNWLLNNGIVRDYRNWLCFTYQAKNYGK